MPRARSGDSPGVLPHTFPTPSFTASLRLAPVSEFSFCDTRRRCSKQRLLALSYAASPRFPRAHFGASPAVFSRHTHAVVRSVSSLRATLRILVLAELVLEPRCSSQRLLVCPAALCVLVFPEVVLEPRPPSCATRRRCSKQRLLAFSYAASPRFPRARFGASTAVFSPHAHAVLRSVSSFCAVLCILVLSELVLEPRCSSQRLLV